MCKRERIKYELIQSITDPSLGRALCELGHFTRLQDEELSTAMAPGTAEAAGARPKSAPNSGQ